MPGLTIASAVPPLFEAYATIVIPQENEEQIAQVDVLIGLLDAFPFAQPWWLGYLDTGSDDSPFPEMERVVVYTGWPYSVVQGSPEDARRLRLGPWRVGPDLIFPVDRSWFLTHMWDDDWWCFGGPGPLVDTLVAHRGLEARQVASTDDDATPPGHVAR